MRCVGEGNILDILKREKWRSGYLLERVEGLLEGGSLLERKLERGSDS